MVFLKDPAVGCARRTDQELAKKNRQKIRNVIGQNDKYGVETDDESKILIVRRQNHENKHILGKNVHFVIK